MTDYIRWDFDKKEATKFERVGDCNGCGACCRSLIKFRVGGHPINDDPRNLSDAIGATDGVWAEVSNDDKRRFFQVESIEHNPEEKPCSQVSDDNKCMVHFDKPHICDVWPVIPEQVTPFPECSYSFVEIARWSFE